MAKIGLWHISSDRTPSKLPLGDALLEQHLEDWIEAEPSLLQTGLTIIGRQINVTGGRLDLLALDPQGRLVIIELKASQLHRETLAQVLDYASSLAEMSRQELLDKISAYLEGQNITLQQRLETAGHSVDVFQDNQEIVMFVVGIGNIAGLERMVNYLTGKLNVPINVVAFDIFRLPDGSQILSRQMTIADNVERVSESTDQRFEDIIGQAYRNGIGEVFDIIHKEALEQGFYPRLYKKSVMYTPPQNRTRMLFTVWVEPKDGLLKAYVSPGAIAEFYPVTEEEAVASLGPDGWRSMDAVTAKSFAHNLGNLLAGGNVDFID